MLETRIKSFEILRELIREGRLIRLRYGVYARAEPSRLSSRPALIARDGFAGASREALTKLGVDWQFTEAERAYYELRIWSFDRNSGETQWSGLVVRRSALVSSPLPAGTQACSISRIIPKIVDLLDRSPRNSCLRI